METQTQSLAQEILNSTKAKPVASNTLTPEDHESIRKTVEQEVALVYRTLSEKDDRSQFKFNSELIKGVNGLITVSLFPGQPLKQEEAKRIAKQLHDSWEVYIRRAPALKAVMNSIKEVRSQMSN